MIMKVPKSTVAYIWKQCGKIECHVFLSDCLGLPKKCCITREGQFKKLDKACFTCFMQQRSKSAPVSGPLLQEKALQFLLTIYFLSNAQSLKASSGWLYHFCTRHGIQGISLQRAPSANTSAVEPYHIYHNISKLWASSELWAPFAPTLPK